ncbi:MAG TPA: tryptophan 7-halogenase [Candidatus Limnocylindria bacterium]|jgi:FADH2 O2-dependent halogenase|nr:tryptophan 7-halogenase [Candidatus Limnocylindria bacterium]
MTAVADREASAPDFDLAVIGSSFSGSLTAIIARRLGYRVLLLERGQHPRFAIGESSTPLAALLWESLATRFDLPRLLPLAKWGTWQATYPKIGCGLKRGFTFLHHRLDQGKTSSRDRENELLVAASPNDSIADTHWYRPDFDQFLVQEAISAGVEYVDRTEITNWQRGSAFHRLTGTQLGVPVVFTSRWLVDATGPRGFAHRHLDLHETSFTGYPQTEAHFSHFRQVDRWDETFPLPGEPPYPLDDAALHHVFEDGWMWVLRFNNGITSAGFALKKEAASQGSIPLEQRWKRRLERLPQVARQFQRAIPIRRFESTPQLSYRANSAVGERFVLLPMAAGFVDPLLSTGFPLTLLGIERLSESWARHGLDTPISHYEEETFGDLDATAALIGTLYASLDRPRVFQSLSMLYFAAASYTETARRLGRPALAPGFLLRKHPSFGPGTLECLRLARQGHSDAVDSRVKQVIEPFNIAGLADPAKANWYPARASDLYSGCEKLKSTPGEISEMLQRAGFAE